MEPAMQPTVPEIAPQTVMEALDGNTSDNNSSNKSRIATKGASNSKQ